MWTYKTYVATIQEINKSQSLLFCIILVVKLCKAQVQTKNHV